MMKNRQSSHQVLDSVLGYYFCVFFSEQCVTQTHRMATAITGSTEDRGTVSVTTSVEAHWNVTQ